MPSHESRSAAFRRSKEARTRAEHIEAAQSLLAQVSSSSIYPTTPIVLTMAGVHAQLAQVTK